MAGSLILFCFFLIFYMVISDIIIILFRLTGLSTENARFQAISLLTNSGFTTRESEVVVATKSRRRLAQATMLFGYAFTVTIVSTMVNFFMNMSAAEINTALLVLPLLLLVLFLFYKFRKKHMTQFDQLIERVSRRFMGSKTKNSILMVDDYGDMCAANIYLHHVPDILKNVPLSQSVIMSSHNIMVMMVKNQKGEARQANADTVLQQEDIIMVLGKKKDIREVFIKAE